MICAKCQAGVPDESTFCLRCGARLVAPERLAPVNGGGRTVGQVAGGPAATAPRREPAGPAGKQAYTLSFKPLADERLRYRVARWVCELAPAHPLTEVQESLLRGQFSTFLAMTADEAEAARRRIEALGVHPALWHLGPATGAALLLGDRRAPARTGTGWSAQKKIGAVAVGIAVLFLFGLISLVVYKHTVSNIEIQPGGVPKIGGRP
ncbi:MAG TPA: zinc ribbon domain-containing protein [Methylomirabilota bacterium]|jgi:hypothetical protein|nr:zinc ribbon domain-containing protein [Methylomirabilota bacterium]